MHAEQELPPARLPVLSRAEIHEALATQQGAPAEHNGPATLPLPLDQQIKTTMKSGPQLSRTVRALRVMYETGKPPGHRDRLAALGSEIDSFRQPANTRVRRALGSLAAWLS